MSFEDRKLGMYRDITRRDFINGVAALSASSLLPAASFGSGAPVLAGGGNYPPLRSGLRGSHAGSFEVAHALTWGGKSDWGPIEDAGNDLYDLVVVGAGISGLTAAHFFRKANPDARVLILDNHDDFGGHAKRNEFELDGRTILGYGGSQSMEDPGHFGATATEVLRDLGIDPARFNTAYDHGFFRRHGLGGATFFDGRTYGDDQLVHYPLMDYTAFLDLETSAQTIPEAVASMPLADNAKRELKMLLEMRGNRLTDIPPDEQEDYLWTISYRDFLRRHLGIRDPEVFALFQGLTCDETVSIEAAPAISIMSYLGLPGLNATALGSKSSVGEPYIYHFPDGNASIARLLVRKLIPAAAAGSTMDDIVLARFDYSALDRPGAPVQLRLNSTAVRAVHDGDPANAKQVEVTYVQAGQAFRVRARGCVMAGYNAMIPHICPELPAAQDEALAKAIKTPIVYTTVLLNNWRAFKNLGIGFFCSPASWHAVAMLDFPVSMGGYQYSQNPDQPIVLHMERFPKGDNPHATPTEQHLAGRRELYATSFETIERETRRQLAAALAKGGFDAALDIAAITVNRWGHGYATSHDSMFDPAYAEDELPNVVGRQRLGRISIANSDAGAQAYLQAAIEQAHRAVFELQGVLDA